MDQIIFLLDKDLKKKAAETAKKNGLSLSAYLRLLLITDLRKRQGQNS